MFNIFKKKPEAGQDSDQKQELVDAPSSTPDVVASENETLSFTQRLKLGLAKTRQQLSGQLNSLFGGGKIDEDTYEELETILLTSDIGVAATEKLLNQLKKRVSREQLDDTIALKGALKKELLAILQPLEVPSPPKPIDLLSSCWLE